jgi:hypothetical protein
MNRNLLLLLGGLAVAGVVLGWFASPASPLNTDESDPGNITTTTAPRQPAVWRSGAYTAHQPYTVPGGLYHPASAGAGRSNCIEWGFDWIASPPGEAEVGGLRRARQSG